MRERRGQRAGRTCDERPPVVPQRAWCRALCGREVVLTHTWASERGPRYKAHDGMHSHAKICITRATEKSAARIKMLSSSGHADEGSKSVPKLQGNYWLTNALAGQHCVTQESSTTPVPPVTTGNANTVAVNEKKIAFGINSWGWRVAYLGEPSGGRDPENVTARHESRLPASSRAEIMTEL